VSGFDGGVPQKWTLELWDASTRRLLRNVTTKDEPSFTIKDLRGFHLLGFGTGSGGGNFYTTSNTGNGIEMDGEGADGARDGGGVGLVAVIYAHNTQGASSRVVLEARSAAPLLHSRPTGNLFFFLINLYLTQFVLPITLFS
jgi:hypothetical protein